MMKVCDSNINFKKIYNYKYAPNDERFRQANCLILPYEHIREGVDYCFSEYAQEVLQYAKDNKIDGIELDIAATDESYKVLELHSLLLQIGIFVATSIVVPMLVGMVTNYAYDKIKKLHQKEEDVQVRVTFISVKPDGTSKALSYDGPASQLRRILVEIKKITDGE